MEFLANNWLYIVITVLMVYIMSKGSGCCGGHSNDTHSKDRDSQGGGCCGGEQNDKHSDNHRYNVKEKHDNSLDAIKDPVCEMTVNPDTAIKQKINGETYYFCSEYCRAKFVKEQNLI